ncbi:LexA family protein [Liquorilactobacillus capillatus]|uniref:Xre family DNA-binding protein n=1 Tax=Liquorilactobacillus capillatus DSM 19910 TaxID=1423731 RepID=A0A0R1MDW1_9LACO|nr:XRE family transcriptional regulator [Liquorilactobacillus capillatus]KRL02403.1 Xre family DNA-binding protein [Liquorilactobacillus capillatus DSM 19910]
MKSNAEIIAQMQQLAKQQQLSISEVARRVNMAKSAVSKYFNGSRTFPLNRLESFAAALGTTAENLLGVEIPTNMVPVTKVVKIPIIGVIACGDPITAEENVDGYIEEPQESLPSGKLFYLRAKGNSMSPTIPNGANVLIRQQPEVENGEIAAVLLTNDNEATLKRVKKNKKLILLLPDNPKYDPIVSTSKNPIKILGKAIRFISDL